MRLPVQVKIKMYYQVINVSSENNFGRTWTSRFVEYNFEQMKNQYWLHFSASACQNSPAKNNTREAVQLHFKKWKLSIETWMKGNQTVYWARLPKKSYDCVQVLAIRFHVQGA